MVFKSRGLIFVCAMNNFASRYLFCSDGQKIWRPEAPPGFCREMLALHSAEYAKGTSFVISCILNGMGQGNPYGFAYNIF